jgi:hypothetical protein
MRFNQIIPLILVPVLPLLGCASTLFLNPSFVNQQTGEVYPLVPDDRSGFILIRVNNATRADIEFVVTAELIRPSEDDPSTTVIVPVSYNLLTQSDQAANDLGVLVDCPVYRIGLGEDLDRPATEPALYINATAVGQGGVGVPGNVNPLNSDAGNFDCGDTIVFQAREAAGLPGGVLAASFVLDDDAFTDAVTGVDTFVHARSFLEEQETPEE